MAKFVLGALLSLAACASIEKKESSIDTLLFSQQRTDLIANSTTYTAVPSVDGEGLVLTISQADRCTRIETLHSRRTTHVERHADRTTMSALSVFTTVFGFAGVYGYLNADSIAQMQTQSSMPETPAQVRTGSIVAMAIAGVSLLVMATDVVRARDTDRDDGIITAEVPRDAEPCNGRPTGATRVVLDLGSTTLTDTTDGDGRVAFSLTDVPSTAIPQTRQPFGVVIDRARVNVELADDEVKQLRGALADDPRSGWAKDCDRFFHQADAILSRSAEQSAVTKLTAQLQDIVQLCTSYSQQDQARALAAALQARRAELEREAQQRDRDQPPHGAPDQSHDPAQGDQLLGWACAGNSTAKRIAYGAVACVSAHAGSICQKITRSGFKAVEKQIAKGNGLAMAVLDGIVKGLGIEQEVADYAREVCQKVSDGIANGIHLQSPSAPNLKSCALNMVSWTNNLCASVSQP
jgi:hypothetical protein